MNCVVRVLQRQSIIFKNAYKLSYSDEKFSLKSAKE